MAPPTSPPPPYPDAPGYTVRPEGLLTKRGIWAMNLLAIGAVWLGLMVFVLGTTDVGVRQFGRFLVVTGAGFGALASVAGGLGSHRTTDLQNIGLLVLAGFWLFLLGQAVLRLI